MGLWFLESKIGWLCLLSFWQKTRGEVSVSRAERWWKSDKG